MHHAHLLVGNGEKALAYVESLCGSVAHSPDFFPVRESVFGLEAARTLGVLAARSAFTGRKVFLITPDTITLEAQNALLKAFEEPVPGTHFFLVVRDVGMIIPTLLSRMQIVRLAHEDEEVSEAS